MILIKLGGSVITDKNEYRSFNGDQTNRLCREIAESGRSVMIVHGAGSFGHFLAKRFALDKGLQDFRQVPAVAQVQYDTRDLSQMVVRCLMVNGLPAVAVPPGSCFVTDDGELKAENLDAIRSLAHIGILPILFGDMVADRKNGFSVVSGDRIMELMAKEFKPERVVFVSDIDGLYDRDPKGDPDAKLITEVTKESLDDIESGSSVADVTGGVRGKMESMLRMCGDGRDCVLVNGTVPGRLLALLKGEDVPCTKARL